MSTSMHLPTDPAVKAGNPYPKSDAPTPHSDVHMGGDATKNKTLDSGTTVKQQIEDLYKLIDGIETAMMTTRAPNGSLVSRAMQTRQRVHGVDLWFVTDNQSHKLDDLNFDPHVNIAYYKPSTSNWVSVSGRARIVNDRNKIKELWSDDLRAWFGDLQDGVHTGGPEDPRISLIFVEAESAHYQIQEKSAPRALFEIIRGSYTGERPHIGPTRELDAAALGAARKFEE
ncbi:hypothetical protein SpCBS45565_g04156 [Spizellomyces sp. 'palustris']|nr:hypothetical protein SpCBS45565_g04156 [Spizellomyces sp. 'palustris']